jgi:hypothetical protein
MASADDLLNALNGANSRLDDIKGKLDNLKVSTDAITSAVSNAAGQLISTLNNGFSQLVALGNYTNQALYQNDQQNETIICELTHIAKNTCELLNESVVQTRLQTSVEHNVAKLDFLYATVHAEAEVERVRLAELRAEIERCCPPPRHEPPCTYTPCEQPQSIGAPPTVGDQQQKIN